MRRTLVLLVCAFLSLALVAGSQASATCLQGTPGPKVGVFERSVAHAPTGDTSDKDSGKAVAHHHCPCHNHQIGTPTGDAVAAVAIDRDQPAGFDRSDSHPAAPPGSELRPPIT